jgi:hypothetical protein
MMPYDILCIPLSVNHHGNLLGIFVNGKSAHAVALLNQLSTALYYLR